MFDLGWVLAVYVFDISFGILFVVGLDRYVDLERGLGLDCYRCVDPEASHQLDYLA